jgi:hypothetical protein
MNSYVESFIKEIDNINLINIIRLARSYIKRNVASLEKTEIENL